VCFIFFFQAEDGIRDRTVTGVQTCALPISISSETSSRLFMIALISSPDWALRRLASSCSCFLFKSAPSPSTLLRYVCHTDITWRSEERRVGKECSSWWRPSEYER